MAADKAVGLGCVRLQIYSYSSSKLNHLDLQGLEHPVKPHSSQTTAHFCFACCYCSICALPVPYVAGVPKPCVATLAGHMLFWFEQAASTAFRTHRQEATASPNNEIVSGASALTKSALHLPMPVGLHAVPAAAVLAALFCEIKTICALQRRAVMHLGAPLVFHILTGS